MIARSADAAAAEAAMASTFEHALADFQLEEGVVRSSLETADHRLENNRTELAMGSVVAGVGGAVALLLAALGVFGVIGFMVATRTREIGIRIALGASRSRVLRKVLVDALKLVVPGVIGGLLLAVPLVKELSSYSLGVVEPLAYFVAAAITLGVTLLAGWPAARRAAAVEPMSAMRAE
jgi:putative ABC transport system permease protein